MEAQLMNPLVPFEGGIPDIPLLVRESGTVCHWCAVEQAQRKFEQQAKCKRGQQANLAALATEIDVTSVAS
jgi:hypothetical protein